MDPVGKGYSSDFLLLTDWQAVIPEHTPREKTENMLSNIITLLAVYGRFLPAAFKTRAGLGTVGFFLIFSQTSLERQIGPK